jgi:uncharacterized membrane protein YdjX (TVP38/TMEM64 family)
LPLASVAVVGGALGLALLGQWAFGGRFDVDRALGVLREAGAAGWAVPAFVGLYLALTSAMVPAFPLHMAAALAFGLWPALALNVLALNLAGNLQFWAARRGLAATKVTLPFLGEHGFRSMLAIRLLPLPTLVVNVGAGVSSMRWSDYALGTLVGTMPMIAAYTAFADALASGVSGARAQALGRAAAAGLVLVALSWAPVIVRRLRGG